MIVDHMQKNSLLPSTIQLTNKFIKGTVKQIEKGLINDRLCVSKVS